ncbi:type II and III secretion system protein family protein [Stutzerimonas nosocomialis]|uniref:Type II and III secretion system protein family protein n=1 Tax=Stutzerimonas nosocomialis TaxID=1056496 RepID=A0A5R9QEZ9_9GAMM|nr:type II and III secretion system protein family protein [Stutzerimonas nosocomialis]TLX58650.1 type II and III secretion system protein family protein [Stutzerimonas nosocomialis]TLX63671.1 type II and III secretion system protein family protein [Stutzerimonas nosocomialis]
MTTLARSASLLLALLCAAPLCAQTINRGSTATVELAAGEGRILRFEAPVDSVLVAEPGIADLQVVSAGTLYVFGKRPGQTSLIALDGQERELASLSLSVSANAQPAVQAMRRLDPKSGVTLRGAGNRLMAGGEVGSVGEAISLNALIDPASEEPVNTATFGQSAQVNIRVRFAEVSREELLRYGVNWSALFNNGTFSFGLVTSSGLTGASNLIGAGLSTGNVNIDAMLEALQSNGVLEILAEPNITAMTGETASFLAGGEVPIPVPVNRDMIGIEYKPYGVSLLFNPTLLPSGRIALQVRPEVSSLMGGSPVDISGFRVPSFRVRRADTRVEVGSGQTFAIAGLFQSDSSQDIEKLPLLGDMPVLGNLFRSKRFQRNETELVILITPYLVDPVREPSLATPLDPAPAASSGVTQVSTGPFGFYIK